MSNIINFNFESHEIRTVLCDSGDPLFHATDLATALNFKNPRQAISSHIDTEDLVKIEIATKGGTQKASFTNESGMYALIFGSTKEEAKKFKRWVTSEVLPSIRKTGQYRHTISETQAHAISKAVKQKCQHNSTHYQTLYHALYDEFGITSYKELLASDFDNAMAFIANCQFLDDIHSDAIARNLHNLVWHTMHIYQWYKERENAFFALSPTIAGGVHDHIIHAKGCANALHRAFDGDYSKRLI